ncbi:MAG: tryptophan--tRNA ligase [Alphaproteobacteria bacterium]
MKRIISGIQPTGNIHLGNYLGALRNWVNLQHMVESYFFVVDLHAITIHQDPVLLKKHNLQVAALYIAAGIDPTKSPIFIQSDVPAHTEVMWILSCHAPLGWLNRMTQYKDKTSTDKEREKLGLFAYPVLMAADILLYQVSHVPTGEDQKQHLELTRDLALSFNQKYGVNVFTVPEPHIIGAATRVMSLKDGTKKMSKSDPAEGSRLNLLDDDDTIRSKLKKAKTDSLPFPMDKDELQGRPDIANLLTIYSALTELPFEKIFQEFGGRNFSPFKEKLADICIAELSPIRHKYEKLMENPDYLKGILKEGAQKASTIAEKTLQKTKETLGLGV